MKKNNLQGTLVNIRVLKAVFRIRSDSESPYLNQLIVFALESENPCRISPTGIHNNRVCNYKSYIVLCTP